MPGHEPKKTKVDVYGLTVGAAPDSAPDVTPEPALDAQVGQAPAELPARYLDAGLLGVGGMGVVRRVRDTVLNRDVAMKRMNAALAQSPADRTRFVHEAQVLAQLQHPNILSIYDFGSLADGAPYFTMTEIEGETLRDVLRRVHGASDESGWHELADGWNLHRLVDALDDVARAIAYAHGRGVLHRDIKADNVMVGRMGEVLVVDWGLADRFVASSTTPPGSSPERRRSSSPSSAAPPAAAPRAVELTAGGPRPTGVLYGTPRYLAPELARLAGDRPNEVTEVYALGVILYEILVGPVTIEADSIAGLLKKVAAEGLPAVPRRALTDDGERGEQRCRFVSARGAPLPDDLVAICERATALEPADRYPTALAFAEALGAWLDGSQKRDRALALFAHAQAMTADVARLEQLSRQQRSQGVAGLKALPPGPVTDEKRALWALEDSAHALALEAAVLRRKQVQGFRAALAHKPDLDSAHLVLAQHYRVQHQVAEEQRDTLRARECALSLQEHLAALTSESAESRELWAYLDGRANLTLYCEQAEAQATIARFSVTDRRLTLGEPAALPALPLSELPLDVGSYVIQLTAPGFHPATYPVLNRRNDHHDGRDPDGRITPVKLLPLGSLGEHECYVPAGWCLLGGDPGTPNSLPRQRVWLEGFVIHRFPVTHAEYIVFLNDLVDAGDTEAALRHVPREQSAGDGQLGVMVYRFDGRFELPDEDEAFGRHPVTRVEWGAARAYADWLAARTSKPWRLPMEFEWEKAARGVDGRSYPWGEHHDPAWSCIKDSHDGEVRMYPVDAFPLDESVYGVRGTAGNTRDWCLDRFRDEGPPVVGHRLVMPSAEDLADRGFKSTRGGSYGNSASRARSADRDWWFPERSYVGRGFRLVWSVG